METQSYTIHTLPDANAWVYAHLFQPLDNTVAGRSQAFDLAVRFDCFPHKLLGMWVVENLTDECLTVEHSNPQAAIVLASILTAQQEKDDE